MNVRTVKWGAVVGMLALVAACGGGGGGGSAPKPVAKASVTGTALINSAVLTAGVKKAAQAGSPLDGAKVTIRSFDTSGNLVETIETVTNAQGGFAGNVTLRDGGGIVNVKIEKENVISYEKTFPYRTAAELSAGLQFKAELDPLLVKVLSTGVKPQVPFDTAAVGDMVSIAVVQDARGNRQIVGGKGISAAKAAGGTINWQLDVAKVVFANASTTSLTVKAQNYNPAREEDMKRFPAQNADTGERLVSAAFDFIDIKDQSGKPLTITKSAAKAARKSAAVAYRVRKQIPDCGLIVKDEDPTKAGVQIGFYFMRNGRWNKLGVATLYKDSTPDDTNLFQLTDVSSCSPASLPYAVLTDADISKDIDFDLRWFNFDYVAFGEIKEGCIAASFNLSRNGVESPLGGVSVSLSRLQQGSPLTDVKGFRSAYGYTTSDGTARIDFTYSGDVTLSSPMATIFYYDPVSYQNVEKTFSLSTKNTDGCYVIDPVTILSPECRVTGKVLTSSGAPAAGRYVNVYKQGYYQGSQWVITGSDGTYASDVFCSLDYNLSVDGITRSFTVDGTVPDPGDEKTDAGGTVTMNDIQKLNQKPSVYIWSGNSSAAVNDGVALSGYGYDPDGDSLSYLWTVEPGCGGFASAAGGATTAASTQQTVRWIAPATPPGDNFCTLSLRVSDGSLTDTATTDIYVSETGNRPPVITWLYAPAFLREGSSGMRLYVWAYDPEGGQLQYNWTSTCGTLADATTSSPTFTPPGTSGSCDVTATVSDGTSDATRTLTIQITANNPPVIIAARVPPTMNVNSQTPLLGTATDVNGDQLSWAWSIVSGGGTLSGTCSGTGSNGMAVTAGCIYTAPGADTQATLRFSVSDGMASAVTRDVSVNVTSVTGGFGVTVR